MQVLLQLLAHENIASRAPIFETYDKQVQGRTVIEAGWADAGVMQPFNEDQYPEEIRQVGIALSLDQNPRYNKIDAYWGAVNAVVESVRNVVAVGATPLALQIVCVLVIQKNLNKWVNLWILCVALPMLAVLSH